MTFEGLVTIGVFLIALPALAVWLLLGRWAWAAFTNPPSARQRIKRTFEGDGRKVTKVVRTGTIPPGRYSPAYRCYEAEVLRHDGVSGVFKARLSAGLFSDDLVDVEAARRRLFNQGSKTWFKDVESL